MKQKRIHRKGRGRDGNRELGNQVEKWEGGEGNQVSDNFIHPCFKFCFFLTYFFVHPPSIATLVPYSHWQ